MNSHSDASERKLRVLFFDHVATLSGGEIALFNLVRHLDLNLIDPVVVLGERGLWLIVCVRSPTYTSFLCVRRFAEQEKTIWELRVSFQQALCARL